MLGRGSPHYCRTTHQLGQRCPSPSIAKLSFDLRRKRKHSNTGLLTYFICSVQLKSELAFELNVLKAIGKTRVGKQRQIQKSSEGMSETGGGIKSDLALIKKGLLRLYIRSTECKKNVFLKTECDTSDKGLQSDP